MGEVTLVREEDEPEEVGEDFVDRSRFTCGAEGTGDGEMDVIVECRFLIEKKKEMYFWWFKKVGEENKGSFLSSGVVDMQLSRIEWKR